MVDARLSVVALHQQGLTLLLGFDFDLFGVIALADKRVLHWIVLELILVGKLNLLPLIDCKFEHIIVGKEVDVASHVCKNQRHLHAAERRDLRRFFQ